MMRPDTQRAMHHTAALAVILGVLGILTRTAALLFFGILVGGVVFAVWRFRGGSRIKVQRLARRSRKHDGTASNYQVLRFHSRQAIRRRAGILAPGSRLGPEDF